MISTGVQARRVVLGRLAAPAAVAGSALVAALLTAAPAAAAGSAITGAGSGKCVDLAGGDTTNGVQMALWGCNGGANQQVTRSSGRLQVLGKCLDAEAHGRTAGTRVLIWDCNGGANQQWRVNSDGSISGVESGLCLDATAEGTANGTALVLWGCHGRSNQSWRVAAAGSGGGAGTVPTTVPTTGGGTGGGTASRHKVTRGALVNRNATPEARAMMRYLYDQYGNHILSGQYNIGNINWVSQNIGRTPAVGGFDLIEYSPSRVARGSSSRTVEDTIGWYQRGGIPTVTWHWNAPSGLIDRPGGQEWYFGFYTKATTFDVNYAMNNTNSPQYRELVRDIDTIAVQLKRMQAAGVPVLWRPLHEAEGGWFWWGAKGPDACKKLYRLMYDRLTNYHRLNNLIWVWNSLDPAWYPGSDVVDMVSVDTYPAAGDHSTQSSQYRRLVNLTGDTKIVAMSENGAIPDPARLQAEKVDYSWFATWNGFENDEKQNARAFQRTAYNSPYVVTLDELPKNLRTYP